MFTVDSVVVAAAEAAQHYYRLVVVAGPKGAGKTVVLKQAHGLLNSAWVNLGLELSQQLLEMTERQRTLRLQRTLDDILMPYPLDQIVIFDNTEILFDRTLAQNPLSLLQSLSRNRTLIVSWSGAVDNGWLIYAAPGHPEYQRYPAQGLLIVRLDS
jgi:predicted ABC-type ATPase